MTEDVLHRSDRLDEKVRIELQRLERGRRQNQRLLRLLAAAVAVEFALVVAVGAVGWQAFQATSTAQQTVREQRATCLAGNDARRAQIQLWGYILELPPAVPRTPAQEQLVQDFRAYIARVFAPRHC